MAKLFLCLFILSLQMFMSSVALFATSRALPSLHPRSHIDECAALIKFREILNFPVNDHDYNDFPSSRKLGSWKLEGQSGNCCAWDGVQCDGNSGHVIHLDLSLCNLHGSIDSNSSLFRLVHLQELNLALNNFSSSPIPSAIGNLLRLKTLNLSNSEFEGQIPLQILNLTNLSSLDLSLNFLEFKQPNLETIIQSLTKLERLYMDSTGVYTPFPSSITNLSSLETLVMSNCGLHGQFPASIFKLPNLKLVDLSSNPQLSGHFPEFDLTSPLESVLLQHTNFSGELPRTLGNLGSLTMLDIRSCNFRGVIPSSASNLTRLTILDLSGNRFHGSIDSLANSTLLNSLDLSGNKFHGPIGSLANMSRISYLDLSFNQFTGPIPSELGNSVQLELLDMSYNQLTGRIPSHVANLTRLYHLSLRTNHLTGPVPSNLTNLTQLSDLDLSWNILHGTIDLDMFFELNYLYSLRLSFNNLSVISKPDHVASNRLCQLDTLELASCNLLNFPKILQSQRRLWLLDLSSNRIQGTIPMWFLNVSMEYLWYLNLSRNHPTAGSSFIETPLIFKWSILRVLDLSFSELQGPMPIPRESIVNYFASNNGFTGEISPLICNCGNMEVLDLSRNNLKSVIPKCLGNSMYNLKVVNLRDNRIYGRIPSFQNPNLLMIDLSNNQLQGQIPRSMSRCSELDFLNLGGNLLIDTFPSWLSSVYALRVLILRSNNLYGVIEEPQGDSKFFSLQIIDLSRNNFTGCLPSKYFQSWKSMRISSIDRAAYIGPFNMTLAGSYDYSMTITNKGNVMEYQKILNSLKLVDLSSNHFSGEIPDSIATLTGLRLLNLSNNLLTGAIPSSLSALIDLEALDLSQNHLSGEIPQELTQLMALEFFNVSNNNLLFGPIPQGKQFNTFGENSYQGNKGLCGDALPKKCGDLEAEAPPPLHSQSPDEDSVIEWKAIAAGYAFGFVVAAIVGHLMIMRRSS